MNARLDQTTACSLRLHLNSHTVTVPTAFHSVPTGKNVQKPYILISISVEREYDPDVLHGVNSDSADYLMG